MTAHSDRSDLELRGPRVQSIVASSWHRRRLDVAGGNLVDLRLIDLPFDSMLEILKLLEDLYYEEILDEPSDWDWIRVPTVGESVSAAEPYHQVVYCHLRSDRQTGILYNASSIALTRCDSGLQRHWFSE